MLFYILEHILYTMYFNYCKQTPIMFFFWQMREASVISSQPMPGAEWVASGPQQYQLLRI